MTTIQFVNLYERSGFEKTAEHLGQPGRNYATLVLVPSFQRSILKERKDLQ